MGQTAQYWYVEDKWPGSTVAVLGGGPSLTQEQVNRLRGRCKVIATSDQIRLAPWADVHYFCDDKWWRWHRGDEWYRSFAGIRVTLENPQIVAAEPTVKSLRNYGWDPKIPDQVGLMPLRNGVLTGKNSGYQALQIAAHLGAVRILLLGFDMQPASKGSRSHWFGDHPDGSGGNWHPEIARYFDYLVAPLKKRGIEVLNCTPASAIGAFPKVALESVLPDPAPAALPA